MISSRDAVGIVAVLGGAGGSGIGTALEDYTCLREHIKTKRKTETERQIEYLNANVNDSSGG